MYNPDKAETLHNIESYLPQIDDLFVVDNSDSPQTCIFINDLNYPKIHYYYNQGNQGIANALNKGLQYANEFKIDWLLFLDQDSAVPQGYVDAMKQFICNNDDSNIGMITSIIKWGKNIELTYKDEKPQQILIAITSGSLLNVSAGNIVGSFEEFLFIDGVDIDYSLRMNLKGYRIIQLSNIHLIHQLGDCEEIRLFKKHIAFIGHHSPIRKYYATRNALYIVRKYKKNYPHYCKGYWRSILFSVLKIIFFEANKINKLKASYYGYLDYKNNIWGKISVNTLSKFS